MANRRLAPLDNQPKDFSFGTVAAILAIEALARIAAAIVLPDQGELLPDIQSYRDSAQELINGWRMVDPTQMPLYPLLIALAGSGQGQLAADIVLSVAMVWLIHALTLELFADRPAAAAAAIIAACYLPLIYVAVVGLAETLFITLMLAAFLAWYRAAFVVAAICAVLAVLTRPVFDLAAPLLVIAFALLVHRLSPAETSKRLFAYIVVYLVLMAPWWLHNYRLYGSFVRLNPNLGWVLYAGNNPLNQSGGGLRGIDYDLSRFNRITDPIARDRAMRDAALAYIAENPGRFMKMGVVKLGRILRLWPASEQFANPLTIAASVVSFVPVLLLGIAGFVLALRDIRRLAPILLFGAGYLAVHMALVGTIRYRLPLEPFLICFSGLAVSGFVRNIATRRAAAAHANGYGG